MNVENTNTPNGGSNLYEKNVDRVEFNFLALEERDPAKEDVTSDVAGSNSNVVPVEIGTIDTENIQKVGYVGIIVTSKTREEYESDKAKIKARAEKSQIEHENDKNRDGIDDRNQ